MVRLLSPLLSSPLSYHIFSTPLSSTLSPSLLPFLLSSLSPFPTLLLHTPSFSPSPPLFFSLIFRICDCNYIDPCVVYLHIPHQKDGRPWELGNTPRQCSRDSRRQKHLDQCSCHGHYWVWGQLVMKCFQWVSNDQTRLEAGFHSFLGLGSLNKRDIIILLAIYFISLNLKKLLPLHKLIFRAAGKVWIYNGSSDSKAHAFRLHRLPVGQSWPRRDVVGLLERISCQASSSNTSPLEPSQGPRSFTKLGRLRWQRQNRDKVWNNKRFDNIDFFPEPLPLLKSLRTFREWRNFCPRGK